MKFMNMLIIGNGFDLAHRRPTTYSDFLLFLDLIQEIRICNKNRKYVKEYLDKDCGDLCPTVKEYLLSSFDTRLTTEGGYIKNRNAMVQELYDCLHKNVWYSYFQLIHTQNEIHGKNWIDFEGEIREVIEFFDHEIGDVYERWPGPLTSSQEISEKIACFSKMLDFSEYNQINKKSESYKNTYYNFIEKTYLDLEKLIRCLEIYLDNCVNGMPISYYSPDIQKLAIDSVLSFNYTAIPIDIYPLLKNSHYIHGRATANRPAEKNSMVLGVNEYWDEHEKNSRTNFNCYKKFVQRIIKETGIDYKSALQKMTSEYNRFECFRTQHSGNLDPQYNNVYIFGHSLDVTDGDILREVIRTEGVVTTIFYRNKQQQSDQIANLSKVLGQDELLKRVFSTFPTIIFKQQADMVRRT